MDLNIWAAAEYAIGQPFFFLEGQRVICNGHPGVVAGMYDKGIVEVRLGSGRVCCSAAYPDVYPDPLDLIWRMEPTLDRLTLFNRTGREFIVLRRQGRKWVSEQFSRQSSPFRGCRKTFLLCVQLKTGR